MAHAVQINATIDKSRLLKWGIAGLILSAVFWTLNDKMGTIPWHRLFDGMVVLPLSLVLLVGGWLIKSNVRPKDHWGWWLTGVIGFLAGLAILLFLGLPGIMTWARSPDRRAVTTAKSEQRLDAIGEPIDNAPLDQEEVIMAPMGRYCDEPRRLHRESNIKPKPQSQGGGLVWILIEGESRPILLNPDVKGRIEFNFDIAGKRFWVQSGEDHPVAVIHRWRYATVSETMRVILR